MKKIMLLDLIKAVDPIKAVPEIMDAGCPVQKTKKCAPTSILYKTN